MGLLICYLILFLLAVLSVIAIVFVVLILCKRLKGALATAISLLVVIAMTFGACLQYRGIYGWWFDLEARIRQDHPAIYQIDATMTSSVLKIMIYTKSPDRDDMEAAYQEINDYINSDEGMTNMYSHYVSIDFAADKNSGSSLHYGSSKSHDNTFTDWTVKENTYQ